MPGQTWVHAPDQYRQPRNDQVLQHQSDSSDLHSRLLADSRDIAKRCKQNPLKVSPSSAQSSTHAFRQVAFGK
jgi:hypothetical protein